jgi:phage tail sheath protein FI
MSPQYATPGVFIEEITGPSVIEGVGTSTAAFVGPTIGGPLLQPTRITSLDDFLRVFGGTRNGRPWPYLYVGSTPYYLGFGVEGFFSNGGTQAFVVRVGTARQSSLAIENAANQDAFVVRALADGVGGDGVTVAVEQSAVLTVATGSTSGATVFSAAAPWTVQVPSAKVFAVNDEVTTNGTNRATVTQIQGSVLTLDKQLTGAANGNALRIADLIKDSTTPFRLISTDGLSVGANVTIDGPGNAKPAVIDGVNSQTGFITLQGGPPAKYTTTGATTPTLTIFRTVAVGQSHVDGSATVANASAVQVTKLTVHDPELFLPGDIVVTDGHRAAIDRIQGNDLTLDTTLQSIGSTVRIANIVPGQKTFRLSDVAGLAPGSVLQLQKASNDVVVVASVTPSGLVAIRDTPAIAHTYDLSTATAAPKVVGQEFRLVITPPSSSALPIERIGGLSLDSFHPRYVLNPGIVTSAWISVVPPDTPPTATYPNAVAKPLSATALAGGQDDHPENLTSVDYHDGLDRLRDVDDVNLVVVPDAAGHPERQTIQQLAIEHCLGTADRFAILDSVPKAPPYGPGSVEEQRTTVTADRGFAALYYPWLLVRDPTSSGPQPRTMTVPPSGSIAGVFARTDQERGVHKAPANTDIRGVLGIEQRLSDRLQGPLNLEGVNVLRIFPGNAQVIVWGARTTELGETDWLYVNVRRLLLFIEESVQQGIRWAVFEGNDKALWQKLKRTINAFLTQVWQDGGLFGDKAEHAFQVRIDEALNPPSERALGRLHIEIKVAPVRPAEFIIVRIGLWDGGDSVSES